MAAVSYTHLDVYKRQEMVDALYSGEVKAMILNTSYVSVITDTEGYEDFETKTKVLYAYTCLLYTS